MLKKGFDFLDSGKKFSDKTAVIIYLYFKYIAQ